VCADRPCYDLLLVYAAAASTVNPLHSTPDIIMIATRPLVADGIQ